MYSPPLGKIYTTEAGNKILSSMIVENFYKLTLKRRWQLLIMPSNLSPYLHYIAQSSLTRCLFGSFTIDEWPLTYVNVVARSFDLTLTHRFILRLVKPKLNRKIRAGAFGRWETLNFESGRAETRASSVRFQLDSEDLYLGFNSHSITNKRNRYLSKSIFWNLNLIRTLLICILIRPPNWI